MKAIEMIEKEAMKKEVPAFRVGDTLKIHIKVKEGDKSRIQVFEGTCIRKRGRSINASFSVLKETHGDVVEKILPLYSPTIEKIVVVKEGKTRRARMYHLRKKKAS